MVKEKPLITHSSLFISLIQPTSCFIFNKLFYLEVVSHQVYGGLENSNTEVG